MATINQTTDIIVPGLGIYLADDDELIIAPGVTVSSQGYIAVLAGGSNHDIEVQGTIFGGGAGINVSNGTPVGNVVHVASTGSILGASGIYQAGEAEIVNEGTIDTWNAGLTLNPGASQTVSVTNSGAIESTNAIFNFSLGTVELFNTGSITGNFAYASYSTATDRITNQGTMTGDVALGAGDDLFDNRGGTLVNGAVDGGDGRDTFLPGAGAETVDGGAGVDTLDFRSSAGLRVSLADVSGTNEAAGDAYARIERVLGSRTGADTLVGDANNNDLFGYGGADALEGGGGNDVLVGGRGADVLTGGLGNDRFQFTSLADAGDVITDWGRVAGDNDAIKVRADAFGGGLVAGGKLDPSQFESRADNVAQDADDRFVFCTTDSSLWFDADGTGAGAAVMVADLQAGATMTAADIFLI